MAGMICLDITTHNVQRSNIELCLSEADILDVYNSAFKDHCPVCHSEVDPPGVVCCECFSGEMEHHKDCCVEERCP